MTSANSQTDNSPTIRLSLPCSADGPHLHDLVARCKPLDENSIYCNLLHCSHFANTSVAAWRQDRMVGFVSGYVLPESPTHYFLWQVAVDDSARGQGLAKRMIQHILQRPEHANLRFLETTITPDNQASWALFRSLAKDLNCAWDSEVYFERQTHFHGAHDDEHLMRIGPFQITKKHPNT